MVLEPIKTKVAAVIVAGGSGTRFGGDKMMADLLGVPVIVHTLRAFEVCSMVDEIVLVTREDAVASMRRLCESFGMEKLSCVVPGGTTRAGSSYAGVMAVSRDCGIIAIHDGARPLVAEAVIEEAVLQAAQRGAAVPSMPVKDTVKKARENVVFETPDRAELFAVQTPQCFRADMIRPALADAREHAPEITDDCLAVERLGGKIYLTAGSEENLKITTPLDLALAELILKRRSEA